MNTRIPMLSAALFAAFTGITQADSEVMNFAAWSQQASSSSVRKTAPAHACTACSTQDAKSVAGRGSSKVASNAGTRTVRPVPTGQGNVTTITDYHRSCKKCGVITTRSWASWRKSLLRESDDSTLARSPGARPGGPQYCSGVLF